MVAGPTMPLRHFSVVFSGILAQENLDNDPHARGSSYIAASYVKHLESAGARVVPIQYDEKHIFCSLNLFKIIINEEFKQ